jgi:hypothetical protein
VRATLDLPGAHGQHGLRPIDRLDLRFFADAQHQRFVRRIEIQPTMSRTLSMNSRSFESLIFNSGH